MSEIDNLQGILPYAARDEENASLRMIGDKVARYLGVHRVTISRQIMIGSVEKELLFDETN